MSSDELKHFSKEIIFLNSTFSEEVLELISGIKVQFSLQWLLRLGNSMIEDKLSISMIMEHISSPFPRSFDQKKTFTGGAAGTDSTWDLNDKSSEICFDEQEIR
jgi:hypothetical protein